MKGSHAVHCQRHLTHRADNIWRMVSDFYSEWHPFIEQCEQEATQRYAADSALYYARQRAMSEAPEAVRPDNANLPDIRFEALTGAGHIANLEQPAAYNQLLTEFLQRISKQTG